MLSAQINMFIRKGLTKYSNIDVGGPIFYRKYIDDYILKKRKQNMFCQTILSRIVDALSTSIIYDLNASTHNTSLQSLDVLCY